MALRTAPCLVVALTIACSSTVSSTDAATTVDVVVDATEAGACGAPRTCFGATVTPRVLAGVQGEPGEQRPRAAPRRHGEGLAVDLGLQLAEEPHAQHEGKPIPALTVA